MQVVMAIIFSKDCVKGN